MPNFDYLFGFATGCSFTFLVILVAYFLKNWSSVSGKEQ